MIVNAEHLIPTESNAHPLLKLKGKERRNFVIQSSLITLGAIVILYLIPPYYGLEVLTTKISYFFLHLFGFNPRYFLYEDNMAKIFVIERYFYFLFDSERATYPAISIFNSGGVPNHYLIIRACTGLQAGVLLLGLIWGTPAKVDERIRASYVVLIALFVGNTLRIASMIAITTILNNDFGMPYESSWHYAHDIMGRPLGFFGTIGFTILIEGRNVRILDTISVWMDFIMDLFSKKKQT